MTIFRNQEIELDSWLQLGIYQEHISNHVMKSLNFEFLNLGYDLTKKKKTLDMQPIVKNISTISNILQHFHKEKWTD